MSVPERSLDDRTFQDIVDEAKRRIPDHMPEWTNHNVSDPGVALIELFAWMTDMTLFRLNQFPDRAMAKLLNTVGFQPFPARPATANVTFFLSEPKQDRVEIEAGTKLGTVGGTDGPIVFETDRTVFVRQPGEFVAKVENADQTWTELPDRTKPVECFRGLAHIRETKWDPEYTGLAPSQRRHWKPRDPFHGDQIRFGFDRSLGGLRIRIRIEASVDGLGINPADPPTVWEAQVDKRWVPCSVRGDTTKGLNEAGDIDIEIPYEHSKGDDDHYWIRLRVDVGKCPMYKQSPTITVSSFTTVGAVVPAQHAERRGPEPLGTSDGRAGQTFVLGGSPLLDRDRDTERILVDGEEWTEVTDFRNTGEDDPHYTVDSTTGEVAFGPEVRNADGTKVRYGRIPPKDKPIEMSSYRVGGGARGNVAEQTITSLRSTVSGVDKVVNFESARGGVDAETPDEAIARAPMSVRAGDRAVTTGDFERMVRDVDRTLHRVVARRPANPSHPVRVLIVPHVDEPVSSQRLDSYCITADLGHRIEQHLDDRRLVGTSVEVRTPYYQGVSIAVRVQAGTADELQVEEPAARADPTATKQDDEEAERLTVGDVIRDRVTERLYEYINPITGGDDGTGIDFGEPITIERIEAVIREVPGVRGISKLFMYRANARQAPVRRSEPVRRIDPRPDTLFMSVGHQVVIDDEPSRTS